MAFLDNSGDIILDAVLTDTGRFRLAKGDGSFKITHFALADDEINYANYDKNNASGSAYYDLTILQTPVLEAFTNNTSTMKSKLISIPRTNLLYLPVLQINNAMEDTAQAAQLSSSYWVASDTATEAAFISNAAQTQGILGGATPGIDGGSRIVVDQGLDTTELSPMLAIDNSLKETQYMIQMDSRLGEICSVTSGEVTPASFIDDDHIAHYYLSLQTDTTYVGDIGTPETTNIAQTNQVISGPRGTRLSFKIQATTELQSSTYLFTTLGSSKGHVRDKNNSVASIYYVDTNVRVMGVTTGYALDIPVRFIKCLACIA